jgi:ATP-dependent DNA helicase HFM1/MER3
MVTGGLGYFNASVTYHDRCIIEELFIAGHLKIICTTIQLSIGMSLPAMLVVVKGTKCLRSGHYKEYTQVEIEQMVGRVSRRQFEAGGTAIIMTTPYNV